MKNLIGKKTIKQIKCLFSGLTEYESLYNQIQQLFKEDRKYQIFAQPIYLPERNEISWFTDLEGEITPFVKLSVEQKQEAEKLLGAQIGRLYEEIQKMPEKSKFEISSKIDMLLEIPEARDIYVVKDSQGAFSHVVLTQWGCVSEAHDAMDGILKKYVPADWIPMNFQIIFDDQTPADNEEIIFEYGGKKETFTSDENGNISLGELKAYTKVIAYQLKGEEKINLHEFICFEDEMHQIIIPKPLMMKFIVLNEHEKPLPGVPFYAEYHGKTFRLKSNNEGRAHLKNAETGNVVEVYTLSESEDKANKHEFSFEEIEKVHKIIIRTPVTETFPLKIKVVKKKKQKAVPKAKVRIKYGKQKARKIADENGIVFFEDIEKEQHLKVKAKKRGRFGKKKIDHNTPDEHIVRIKMPPYWLLLFLLLPFLLLIQWNKDVTFKVVDTYNPSQVPYANVRFSYPERSFFDFRTKQFFTYKQITRDNATEKGISNFPGVRTTVFQWLFYRNEPAIAIATGECLGSDTLKKKFIAYKNKKEEIINMSQLIRDFVFVVVDKTNNQPIPDAEVKVLVNMPGTYKRETGKTNAAGEVLFKSLPVCADFEVTASAYGYEKETIKTDGKSVYHKGNNKIKLTPKTETVVFFVKNAVSKQAVPGANATLLIDGKVIQSTRTNTNGAMMIGRGQFNEVPILKDIIIRANHEAYHDSSLSANAGKFIKLPAAQRVVYLRPKPANIEFIVLDAVSKQPISGARISLTKNGRTQMTVSNGAGVVNFADMLPGDKITVKAGKDPKYERITAYQNEDVSNLINGTQQDRTIYLMPKTPPPPPPPPPNVDPCNGGTDATHANATDVSKKYNMGKSSGEFVFEYYTDNAPDRILVYSGNRKVFEYYGATRSRTKSARLPFYDQVITVRVIGGTKWNYTVNCP